MILSIYQVDAFTDQIFSGNPAAVCPLEFWPSDELLQNIASENNLSETAFFRKKDNLFEIRWFTPVAEVEFCFPVLRAQFRGERRSGNRFGTHFAGTILGASSE